MWRETVLMMGSGDANEGGGWRRPGPVDPSGLRDLGDFCTHWPELRTRLVNHLDASATPADINEIVRWLIMLADRVCPVEDFDER